MVHIYKTLLIRHTKNNLATPRKVLKIEASGAMRNLRVVISNVLETAGKY